MIRNQWYAVLDGCEVKKKPVGVTRLGEKLVFWRDELGNVSCMSDRCAHRGAALSIGKVFKSSVTRKFIIECPFHGLEYDGSGKCVQIPANGKNTPVPENFKVLTYPCKEKHGLIWIFWGDKKEILPEIEFFEDLDSNYTYTTVPVHWDIHYSRAIENQLDVVHLPFVHYNTIGKGCKTLVDGPLTNIEGKRLFAWVSNKFDDGSKPKRSDELTIPENPPIVNFIFPNIWHLRIADPIGIFVAFAPIDDENTMMYLRSYHKIKMPIIKNIVNFFGRYGVNLIQSQDRRVVITQRPKQSSYQSDENLLQGDLPIITYRKKREELKRENNTNE